MTDRVALTVSDQIARITLNRPDRHNGVDMPMLKEMAHVQKALRRDRRIRAAVLHGAGPSFCAGLDVKSLLLDRKTMLGALLRLCSPWRNLFQSWSLGLRELPFPVVAAVHGNCFGAGIQLALGADLRVAAPDANLSVMEMRWGLIPDMGGSVLLRELMPIDQAKSLIMSGRILSAHEALQLGLVTKVVADPLEAAEALARELSDGSPDAVAAGKFLLQRAWQASDGAALRLERYWQRRLIGRANQRIAVRRQLRPDKAPPYAARTIEK